MAPLLHLTSQILISLGSLDFLSQRKPCQTSENDHAGKLSSLSTLSTVSWGYNRMDVFGLGSFGHVYHKWFDGYQWNPAPVSQLESLGGTFTVEPRAVSWGANRADIFTIGSAPDEQIYHKYWDGYSWVPGAEDWEGLGGSLADRPLAVSSW